MSSKHLRRNALRQPAAHHPWGGRAFDVILALALAMICAVLVDLWLHPAEAGRLPGEAPTHFAIPGAPPRCPVALTDLAA